MVDESAESVEQMQPFGHLVVLGVKPDITKDGKLKLRPEARFRLHAAATIFKRGGVEKIIVSGGKTHGDDMPSESDVMKKFLVTTYGIPEDAIEEEYESKTTAENLANIQAKIPADSHGKVAILTDVEHLKRVAIMLEKQGANFELVDSESTLHESGPQRIVNLLEKFEKSPKYHALKAKEVINRLILVVDKNDYVHRVYARLTRR